MCDLCIKCSLLNTMLPLVALHNPLADNTDCIFCQETDDIVNLSQCMFFPGGSAGP